MEIVNVVEARNRVPLLDRIRIFQLNYNYNKPYVKLESPFLNMLIQSTTLRDLICLPPDAYVQWYRSKKQRRKSIKLVNSLYFLLRKMPPIKRVTVTSLYFLEALLRRLVSNERIVILLHHITKLLVGNSGKGATQAIVVARKIWAN